MGSVTISVVSPKIKLAFGREILEGKKLLSAYSEERTKMPRELLLFILATFRDRYGTNECLSLHECL